MKEDHKFAEISQHKDGDRRPTAVTSTRSQSQRDTFLSYSTRTPKDSPRLIERNLPFHQSHNKFNIKNKFGQFRYRMLWNLYRHDWFHVMMRWPTALSILLLICIWTSIILIFAKIYVEVGAADPSVDCGLAPDGGPIQWNSAFAFSLQTCTTVGYTLPGSSWAFFRRCPTVQITIYFQLLVSMIFNAFLLAFFYGRLARCEMRAYQVVFTDKAIIRRDYEHADGRLKFEFKVYDADSCHAVVEAHVRLFVVHRRSTGRNYTQMRITQPNDDLGAMLLTSIPSIVSHQIDLYSPLLPPDFRPQKSGSETICPIVNTCGLTLREADSYVGSREGVLCPICGESYGFFQRLEKHVKYNQIIEKYSDPSGKISSAVSHLSLTDEKLQAFKKNLVLEAVKYEDIGKYFKDTGIEVIVLVEGIDPLTSGTFQALHSYQAEDIVFGSEFGVSFTAENEVDFELFHGMVHVDI